MGRSITYAYRVQFYDVTVLTPEGRKRVHWEPTSWRTKESGRATEANLAKYIKGYEDSTQPGGVNEQLGVTSIGAARLVRQADNEVVAIYTK